MTQKLCCETTVENILRENNRFNNTLARLEKAAQPEEIELIQRIRAAQGDALTTVADIANLIRDGKVADAMRLQQDKQYPLYRRIEEFVTQLVQRERNKMDQLRASVAAANRSTLILMAISAVAFFIGSHDARNTITARTPCGTFSASSSRAWPP